MPSDPGAASALAGKTRRELASGYVRALTARGWSMTRIALGCGLSANGRSRVSQWKRGTAAPAPDNFDKLIRLHAGEYGESTGFELSPLDPAPPRPRPEDTDLYLLDQRWRRLYEGMRQRRDLALFTSLDHEDRLAILETKVLGRSRHHTADRAIGRLIDDRFAEARRPSS